MPTRVEIKLFVCEYIRRDFCGVNRCKILLSPSCQSEIDSTPGLSCFNASLNLKKLTIEGNVNNNPIDLHRMVYGGSRATLEEIDFSNFNLNVETLNQAFNNGVGLKRILGVFDLTNATSVNNAFNNCPALEEVRFKADSIFLSISFGSCSALNDESIRSVIDGLADLTGQTTQTLTFHTTVGNKLTDTQKATITAKNWTLAY